MLREALDRAMAENHGLLIQHHSTLCPKKFLDNLQKIYGGISASASFDMTSCSDYLTAVFFDEQKSAERCYSDCLQVTVVAQQQKKGITVSSPKCSPTPGTPKKNIAVIRVGWINDNFWSTWQSKPYIKGRHSSLPTTPSKNQQRLSREEGREGYIIIFWKQATKYQRMEIEVLANERTLELWKDEKEGGRIFLRFATEEEALSFRDVISVKFNFLSRFVSLAEEDDFIRAKKMSVSGSSFSSSSVCSQNTGSSQ